MKKRILLAMAALAMFSGSVMAQTLTHLGSYPAANAVTATDLITAGAQDAANGVTNPVKMTVGGNYKYQATSTDWSTELGATWNSTISGSIFKFVAAPAVGDLTYVESTFSTGGNDGESDHITTGNAETFDLTLTPTANLTSFTFEEFIVKFGETTLGAANVNTVGCSSPWTVDVTAVAAPVWAGNAYTVNNTGDVTIDNPTICTNQIAPAFATISIRLAANTEITTRYINASLTGGATTAGAPLFASEVFETASTAGTVTMEILGQAATASGIGIANFVPGVYTFTVNEVSDDVLNNADNAATLADLADKNVVFTILPAPKPTLTTAASAL